MEGRIQPRYIQLTDEQKASIKAANMSIGTNKHPLLGNTIKACEELFDGWEVREPKPVSAGFAARHCPEYFDQISREQSDDVRQLMSDEQENEAWHDKI